MRRGGRGSVPPPSRAWSRAAPEAGVAACRPLQRAGGGGAWCAVEAGSIALAAEEGFLARKFFILAEQCSV